MTKENKRSLKSSLKKTSKISASVKNAKFEKSYIATKKFANVKKTIINYLTNADSNAKKAEKLKFQGNESKQKAVADLYIYSTTIVTKEDLKSEISNLIKNIFAEITNKNILRFQQKLIRALLVIYNQKVPSPKVLNFIQKNKLRNLYNGKTLKQVQKEQEFNSRNKNKLDKLFKKTNIAIIKIDDQSYFIEDDKELKKIIALKKCKKIK